MGKMMRSFAQAWLAGMLTIAGVSWAQTNNAQFVSQSVPTQMSTNQSANVTVIFKNTGTTSWTATGNDKLGSQNPQDNTTWGLGRVPLNSGETIASGQQKAFQFTIKAPATPGTYNFQTKMVREGVAWYGEASPNIAITVSAPKVYYLHTDHLNTPRLVTDEQKVVVWRSTPLGEPFGVSPPEEDPDGNGQKFEMNLRFPGQYADKETNTNYNYYRDYDPATGRYVQSDPIGLAGGINTYGYVEGNPLSGIDPEGLQMSIPAPAIGPTVGALVRPGTLIDPIVTPGLPDPNDDISQRCASLQKRIKNLNDEIYKKRYPDLQANPNNLPRRIGPGEALRDTIRGHEILLNRQLRRLKELEKQYEKECTC